MIFNTSGGVDPLNFKVVGGATQPSNPKENTIWVNTAAAITSWVFSATQPTGAEGMVWFKIADNGLRSFNALKKNGITLHLVSAAQYLSGAWVTKAVNVYQNSAWQELAQYLYKNGEQYTSLTGGWGLGSGTVSGGKGGFAANADHLSFTGQTDAYWGFGTTLRSVDLTNFRTLHVYGYGNGSGTFGVGTAQDANFNASTVVYTTLTNYSVDISSLSGSYYVKFRIGGSATF